MVIRLLIAIMNQVYYASEEAFASANRQSTAALDRQNMNSATRLQTLLIDSPVGAVLPAIALLNLPNWTKVGMTKVVPQSLACGSCTSFH
jgi:hypothetical protein